MKSYYYQYETSPRKLSSEYDYSKKNKAKSHKPKSKNINNKKKTKNNKYTSKQKKENPKKENGKEKQNKKNNSENIKMKVSIFAKGFVIFLAFFFIIYRNSIITQSFAQIQKLKTSITELQKETNQLEINIQNSININTIEKAAKELLGMQKLNNKQIIYISLPKKDFVESKIEEIPLETEMSFTDKLMEKLKSFF